MRWLFLISLFINTAVYAQAADTADGQQLHDENCLSCHDSMTNGKPEQIYTREQQTESSIQDIAGLKARVQACATNTSAQWFDDEIEQVVEYLNTTYYQFGLEDTK
jgi:mono/diheme cytochrome c family protein